MCTWQNLRANILRDTIYLDGGHIWLQQGFDDGCVNYAADNSFEGYIYTLDLGTSFNTSSNFTDVLQNQTVAGGTASNLAPNYIDGVMFSNENEFYLYGGMIPLTDNSDPPPADEVLGYEGYQYGAYRNIWQPGWHKEDLPTNVTRYITNGAGVSSPSENLGFYFSGMRAANWGAFTYDQFNANVTADTLITVDMSIMGNSSWTNTTLPPNIPGRANAELVWVPVSDSGVLVAIGGVVDPVQFYQNTGLNTTQTAESKKISPTFMETVSVYDVKSQKWYMQNTTGDTPPQLTQFCSVLASASDGSSHNIYIYGGYNGIDLDSAASDDVYILSLPSFTWIKAYSGNNTHGRSGHRCIKVYPDQMLSLGGVHVSSTDCVEGGIVVNFNLNNLTFEESYDPKKWSDYKVPDIVTAKIGGSSSGGATTTKPSSWTNSSLAAIFDKKYSKTITTYWPYNSTNTTSTDTSTHKSGGLPKWAAAVIGVLVGLFVVALLLFGWWFWRRRRRQRPESVTPSFGKTPGAREADSTEVRQLMYGSGPTSPMPGPQSTSTGLESRVNESSVQDSVQTSVSPRTVESGGGTVYEMQDSSPVELATPYNVASDTPATSPASTPMRSPVSPATPEGETAHSTRPGHYRSPSTASSVPSLSIDNVITGRQSYFQEAFETNKSVSRARHGSEISEVSISEEERTEIRGQTIHEDELYIRSGV
ncbi:uncharacterized protein N7496_012357 [Penicillium cataractarum]|uniref:Galactose oxidase/kelch, beta-propeller n=1 Tax=Penicillium cataractarum TaxID=2100454 RepID=A0A9W9R7L4_9EURO|nr:uncharacterized protein N7496_012357 [Penicillium cataractarum]KAJ5355145.1 hypothetical protein N7496_012357 [Penicillium cataractarum]